MLHHSLDSSGTVQASLPIQRSWERCRLHARDLEDDPVLLPQSELRTRIDQYAGLLEAAQPQIQALQGIVSQAQGILLLSDAGGVVLHTAGNHDFLHKADQVALRPGVSWAETHRGTNAIGTALIENTFIRVHGPEHFLACNQILSCNAAPIRSPRGDILGVLDISGDARNLPDYTGELVQVTATQIGNRILHAAGRHNLARLYLQSQPGPLDMDHCGILLLADEHIVGGNALAAALLHTRLAELLDRRAEQWLPDWKRLSRQPVQTRAATGRALFAALMFDGITTAAPVRQPVSARATTAATTPLAIAPEPVELAPEQQCQLRQSVMAINADLAVLLLGETGSGKEVFARHLHAQSGWRAGPFVAINCAALPESLIEAELFGYEPGAFTGAQRNGAKGRLREANGGVLFLDEIGDMPLHLQSRLLRVLQERVVQPLGSDKTWPVNFGLISATNQGPAGLADETRFRQDLYYRVQDHVVQLPALRQRADLRNFICAELKRHERVPSLILHDAALDVLCTYAWPGNYRQLRSTLKTLVALLPPGSIVQPADLPDSLRAEARDAIPPQDNPRPPDAAKASGNIRDWQQEHIRQVLSSNQGNISKTARELGLHRSTLYRHLANRRKH